MYIWYRDVRVFINECDVVLRLYPDLITSTARTANILWQVHRMLLAILAMIREIAVALFVSITHVHMLFPHPERDSAVIIQQRYESILPLTLRFSVKRFNEIGN